MFSFPQSTIVRNVISLVKIFKIYRRNFLLELRSTKKEKAKKDIFLIEEKNKDLETFQFSPEETQLVKISFHFEFSCQPFRP